MGREGNASGRDGTETLGDCARERQRGDSRWKCKRNYEKRKGARGGGRTVYHACTRPLVIIIQCKCCHYYYYSHLVGGLQRLGGHWLLKRAEG